MLRLHEVCVAFIVTIVAYISELDGSQLGNYKSLTGNYHLFGAVLSLQQTSRDSFACVNAALFCETIGFSLYLVVTCFDRLSALSIFKDRPYDFILPEGMLYGM